MNIKVQLMRTLDTGIETTGKLYVNGDLIFTCDTLERTYADNQRGISCIPAGRYICTKVPATEAIPYAHISVTNVPNRSGIKIHKGNLYTHSKGCILLGRGWGDINKDGQMDILNSKNTFDQFLREMPQDFTLHISEAITRTKPKPIA